MKLHHLVILSQLVWALLPGRTPAQQLDWEVCGTFPARVSMVYFYDNDLGFVTIGVPAGAVTLAPAIYRTTNAGKNWARCTTPSKIGFGVNEIFMEDQNNGWAGTDNNNGRIWRTSDGGASWYISGATGGFNSVVNSIRRSSRGIVISDFLAGTIEISSDGGNSFHKAYHSPNSDYVLGLDFVDSVHGVCATMFRSDNKWSYTEDGGATWFPSDYSTESWTVRGIKGTSIFYATPEGLSSTDDYLTEVRRSEDFGKTWNSITTLPFRATSDLEIQGKNLYVQTSAGDCLQCSYPEGKGIYRSTDSGATWHGLGGPEYWCDTRFSVVQSCYGTTIYCCDENNNIYRAFDTSFRMITDMDGAHHTSIIPPDSLTLNGCEFGTTHALITIDTCYTLVIDSEIIVGEYAQAFSLRTPSLPLRVSGDKHSITVDLVKQLDSGVYDVYIHIVGYYDFRERGSKPFDTLLLVRVRVKPKAPHLLPDRTVVIFPDVTQCDSSQFQLLKLTNEGCSNLTVVSGPGKTSSPFSFDTVPVPFILSPGESRLFKFYFKPDTNGSYISEATFSCRVGEWSDELNIPLQGRKVILAPRFDQSPKTLSLEMPTLCDEKKSAPFRLTNNGCDTLTIFKQIDSLPSELWVDHLALPYVLPPGNSLMLMTHFYARSSGTFGGTLSFVARNRTATVESSVLLTGIVPDQEPQLSIQGTSIDLPIVSTCAPPLDTTVNIYNVGCDSLKVISGPGIMTQEFTADSLALPITLGPNEHLSIRVHFHPQSSSNFGVAANLIAVRNSDTVNYSFGITGTGIEGVALLQTAPQAIAYRPMSICSAIDSLPIQISNPGCDTLAVTAVSLSEGACISMKSLALPLMIPPGELAQIFIYCAPKTKGLIRQTITIEANSAHDESVYYKNSINVTGSVGDGTKLLRASVATVDFGAMSLCEGKDTTITLINDGCDTITISDQSVSGSGIHLDAQNLPIIIAPQESIALRISTELDTMGRKSTSLATYTLLSDADSPFLPIVFKVQHIYPVPYGISISQAAEKGAPGDTVHFQILAGAPLSGIHSLDLELSLNQDLLGFVNSESVNTVSLLGDHLHIEGHPNITSSQGLVATLSFEVFLTKDASTEVGLTNPHFNEADPSFEECVALPTVQGLPAPFASIAACGDNSLSEFLNSGLAFRITGISPNPTMGKVKIGISSSMAQSLTVRIYDLSGNLQKEDVLLLGKGQQEAALDLSTIPSGSYTVRLGDGVRTSSVRIIKLQ